MYQDYTDKIKEECAVFGVSLRVEESVGIAYNALLAMQHRGQEGAGIAILNGSSIDCHKGTGLVSEVFAGDAFAAFPNSRLAIGHTRYSTTGNNTVCNVQPFITEYLTGRIATAHNGNVTNAAEIRTFLEERGVDFSASSDTEVVSSLIAYHTIQTGNLTQGVTESAKLLEGAYCFAIMGSNNQLIAVRDPHGFRPLCIGKSAHGIAIASESCALDSCGFTFVRDVLPGEVIVIEDGEIIEATVALTAQKQGACIFEHVYFARPDSIIDGLSVIEARHNMGRILAREYPIDADIVCGIPDSGLEAAAGYAYGSGLPLVTGFVKNRYIGRSFIYPTQAQRENAVQLKLNPLRASVEGKRIVLVDDSIVRGTTSGKIVSLLRDAGAKEVHMLFSSPPFLHTCYFGIDIGEEENLFAYNRTLEEMRKNLGVDSLGFISVEGLLQACRKSQVPFCTGCFTGDYGADIRPILKNAKNAKTQFETA